MSWDDYAYFISVAREGGLSAAAGKLGTSASTVSRHIDALENRLGTTLFIRQPRGYILTEAGTELLTRVGDLERAVMALERVGAASQEVVGTIKLAAPESVAHYLILPYLPTLQEKHPKLRVELLVTRYRTDLARREADIAVRIAEPNKRDFAPDAIARMIGNFDFGLYGSQQLLNKSPDWRELPHISWDSSWTKLPMVEWLREFFPNQEPILRSNSMQAHYLAARAGIGIAMLPRFLANQAGGLSLINTDMKHTTHELWMLHHEDLKASKSVQIMKEFLIKICNKQLRNSVPS